MIEYVRTLDLVPGDVIQQIGKSPLTVVEVHEPSHGVAAAYGFIAIQVEVYASNLGHLTRFHLPLARPHDTFPVVRASA